MAADPRYQQPYGGDDGSILTYATQTRLVKATTGGSLGEEEEVLVGDASKKVPPPTTVIEMAHAMRRWANTVIVANFALDRPVFHPMYMMAYVDMVCYLANYPNMAFAHYCSYVNESRLRLIVDVNENGVDLETALIRARRHLWEEDLPNFRRLVPMLQLALPASGAPKAKVTAGAVPSTSAASTQGVCVKCEQKAKIIAEKNVALAKRNTEIRDLTQKLRATRRGPGGGAGARNQKRVDGEKAEAVPNAGVDND